jgi:toxin FitB
VSRGFLLDTNVPSELTRPSPDSGLVRWVNAQENSTLYLSVVTAGELRRGIALLPESRRREQLERWFSQSLLPLFEDRVLPVSLNVAERWGALSAECQLRGIAMNTADGLIGATALEHGLTLVTRNAKDFAGFGGEILNPWTL